MDCAELTRRLQPLLEDLLQEAEYQDAHAHLAGCRACREHVEAVDSMGCALALLGQEPAPDDLADTILFRLRKEPKPAAPTAPARPRHSTGLVVGGLAVACLAGLWVWRAAIARQPAQDPSVLVTATIVRPQPTATEASPELHELRAIAAALGVDSDTPSPPPTPEQATNLPGPAAPVATTPEAAETVTPGVPSWHAHARLDDEPLRQQLMNALNVLGVTVNYQAPELLVFTAAPWQRQRLPEVLNEIVAEVTPDLATLNTLPDDAPTRCSFTFIRPGTSQEDRLHWHVSLSASAQANLRTNLRLYAVFTEYQSSEVLVFRLPREELQEFLSQVNAVLQQAGMGLLTAPRQLPPARSLLVSLYLTEPPS